MPRGIYDRKQSKRAAKREADKGNVPSPRYRKPVSTIEVYDINQGGFVDLDAANKEIRELKDRMAMLNKELEIAKADYHREDAENNRFRAIIDRLLLVRDK